MLTVGARGSELLGQFNCEELAEDALFNLYYQQSNTF